AVASQRRKGRRPSRRRRPRRRFNGAVASQRRKGHRRRGDARLRDPASMEPSPLSDGKAGTTTDAISGSCTLQWSRRHSETESGALPGGCTGPAGGFNGAVASQRRKGREIHGSPRITVELQWSRRLSATESLRAALSDSYTRIWLQWSRRLSATES